MSDRLSVVAPAADGADSWTRREILQQPETLRATHALLAGHERALSLVTRYFDTPEGALHQAGASLRLRESGAAAEQTFKSAANGNGSVRRGEWNAPVTGPAPDVEAFAPQPRELLQQFADGRQFEPRALGERLRTHDAIAGGEAGHDDGRVVGELADAEHDGGIQIRTEIVLFRRSRVKPGNPRSSEDAIAIRAATLPPERHDPTIP